MKTRVLTSRHSAPPRVVAEAEAVTEPLPRFTPVENRIPPPRSSARGAPRRLGGHPANPTVRPGLAEEPPRRTRLLGVDTARGVALLGMIAVHSLPLVDSAGNATPVGRIAGGTSAALFGFLAGVSVAFLTGRRRLVPGEGLVRRHALRLVVRGLVVGGLGLLLGDLAPGGVDIILTYYGALFLLAVPLVLLSTRVLFGVGAFLMVLAPLTDFVVRRQLPVVEAVDPSFTGLLSDPLALLTSLLFTGAYPVWPWLTYICLGLAVGRCRLEHIRTASWVALCGAVVAALAATGSSLLLGAAGGMTAIVANPGLSPEDLAAALAEGPNGVTPTSTWWWLAVDLPHAATPFSLAYTVGTSMAVLGTMLLLDDAAARRGHLSGLGRGLRAPLAAAGAMTLTFYTAHVVVVAYAADVATPLALFLAQAVAVLLVGLVWRATVGRGPLESFVSRIVDRLVPLGAPRSAPPERRPGSVAVVAAALAAIVLAVSGAAAVAVAAAPPSVPGVENDDHDGPPLDDPEAPDADEPGPSGSGAAQEAPEDDDSDEPAEAPGQREAAEPDDDP